ncbi:YfcE family phosphodiesterase [Candidatus Woesearchaeota archaeon]|nr:YfcE family phosphodiesterase [Candidatus Woesearchaeota archaeon]
MSRIGIISDTHDNTKNIDATVKLFQESNVEFVIHAGDVVAPISVLRFKGLKTKWVFGNCDGDHANITARVKEIGGEHYGRVMDIKHDGRRIIVIHGDNHKLLAEALGKKPDYLIHGHTHIPEDKREGKTRILCPGGHYLGDPAERNQVIILDTEKDEATFMYVDA